MAEETSSVARQRHTKHTLRYQTGEPLLGKNKQATIEELLVMMFSVTMQNLDFKFHISLMQLLHTLCTTKAQQQCAGKS
jgi:hypothetical protein